MLVDLGDHWSLLREVRSLLALLGAHRDSSCTAAGMNRASFELRRETQGSFPFLTSIVRYVQSWNRRVRPRLVLRHGTVLAYHVVHGVSGHLSSWICHLWLFPEDATGMSVPLRVVTSFSGLHSKMCPGIVTYPEWTAK